MLLYNQNPPVDADDIQMMYERAPIEGVIHSAWMKGEQYEMSDSFNENWSCASVCWAVDGEETYRFDNKRNLKMGSAGALTLGLGSRYAYKATSEKPFLSNMITFPHWISNAAGNIPLHENIQQKQQLNTKLFAPDRATQQLMDSIVLACRRGHLNASFYEEASSLLFHKLLSRQIKNTSRLHSIKAKRTSTKSELCRRVEKAQEFILQSYSNTQLDLQAIASFACISKYHLIRVFKDVTGITPMHFLARTRVDSAMSLLKHTRKPIGMIIKAVGYRDRAAFYRAFTNRYNMTPSTVERPTNRRLV